jgi:hypothetical protein
MNPIEPWSDDTLSVYSVLKCLQKKPISRPRLQLDNSTPNCNSSFRQQTQSNDSSHNIHHTNRSIHTSTMLAQLFTLLLTLTTLISTLPTPLSSPNPNNLAARLGDVCYCEPGPGKSG